MRFEGLLSSDEPADSRTEGVRAGVLPTTKSSSLLCISSDDNKWLSLLRLTAGSMSSEINLKSCPVSCVCTNGEVQTALVAVENNNRTVDPSILNNTLTGLAECMLPPQLVLL